MPSNQNYLAQFYDCIGKLMDEDLILVDKNVANLLKCIISTPALKNALEDAMQTCSYVTEFTRARVTYTRPDGVQTSELKLPAEKDRLYVFVICLLAEVDSGRRNFIDFLREYYYASDTGESYKRFCNEVLRPFKKVAEDILKSADCPIDDVDAVQKAKDFFEVETTYVSNDIINKVGFHVENILNQLDYYFDSDSEKHEAIFVCNSLIYSLNYGNPRILKLAFLAFKAFFAGIRRVNDDVYGIGEIVKTLID